MKSHSTLTKYTYKLTRLILSPIIKFLWIKSYRDIHYIKNHKGPAIIAANHQSFFDFLCIPVVTGKNIHFLSAEVFFYHKVWRILMIITGQIKVERKAHDKSDVHISVREHLLKNNLVGIFPEGTRSLSTTEMLKAYTGVARYALEHKVVVIPVGIKGAHEIHAKGGNKIAFKKNVEIIVGKPMDFSHIQGNHTDKEVLEQVTQTIMHEIARLSGKTYPY